MTRAASQAQWSEENTLIGVVRVATGANFINFVTSKMKYMKALIRIKSVFILLFGIAGINLVHCQVISKIDSNHIVLDDTLVFTVVESMPQYIGGEAARIQFINENINYPLMARESGIEGRVFVTFVVEKDGSITDVKILRGIGGGCDEEVVRVIKKMPKWEPGTQRGKPVRVQFNMPVFFNINIKDSGSKSDFSSYQQPPIPDDNYAKGIEKMNEKSYEKAVEFFTESIINWGSDYREAYCTRGICHYLLGDLDQAAADIYKADIIGAMINYDEVASVLFLIANEYLIRNKLPQAIEMYTGSLQLDAGNPRAYYNRGLAYSKSGKAKEAKKDWNKAKSMGYFVPEDSE